MSDYATLIGDFIQRETVAVPKVALAEAYAHVLKLSGLGITGLISSAVQKSSEKTGEQFINQLGSPEVAAVPGIVAEFLSRGGWGEFSVVETSERSFDVEAPTGTLFLERISQSKRPVCHPVTAAIQGFVKQLTGAPKVKVEEISCRARGDASCRFHAEW